MVLVVIAILAAARPLRGDVDPITAFFSHDWASVGGWSLLVGFLVLWVGVGSFREWWVPGPRARRADLLITQQQALIKQQADQISKLTEGNEFTKYIMEQVVPSPQSRGRGAKVSPEGDEGSTS